MRVFPVAFLALLASLSFCFCIADDQFVSVVGFVECADCEKNGIKTSQAFSGLHVTVECKAADGLVDASQGAELNEGGKFTVSINQKVVKLSKECYAKLHNASVTQCSKLLINSNKDSKQDIISITKKLKFSRETCESKFFWKHPLPTLPKLPPHPWVHKSLPPLHPITLPPFHLPPIPVIKKPCPPLYKPPTPTYIPPVFKPPPTPVPVYKPPPVPIYKPKPTPSPVPIYKPPPVPIYKPKPTPTPVPIYKPPPVPVYKPKPTPSPVPIYKPPPVPAYKPKPTPAPKIKKPCPPIVIIKPHPIPPIPIYKPHPLPPLIPKIKKPFPPFPKIDPHKFFHHPKYGKIIPKIPHKFLKHPKLISKLPQFPIPPHH